MLQVSFMMTCIIYKILLLLKITGILKGFLKSKIDFYFYFFFSLHKMIQNPIPQDENI